MSVHETGEAESPKSPASSTRCPYCHEDLADASKVARCRECGTSHHLGCFQEHHTCSVHGCASTRADVVLGEGAADVIDRPVDPAPLTCKRCKIAFGWDEIAAMCPRCKTAQHPSCAESYGFCLGDKCVGDALELLRVPEVIIERLEPSKGEAQVCGGGILLFEALCIYQLMLKNEVTSPPVVLFLCLLVGSLAVVVWRLLGLREERKVALQRLSDLERNPGPHPANGEPSEKAEDAAAPSEGGHVEAKTVA